MRIEETWDLARYRAIQAHWLAHGPPLYLSMAAFVGFNGASGIASELLESPDDIASFLAATPGFGQTAATCPGR